MRIFIQSINHQLKVRFFNLKLIFFIKLIIFETSFIQILAWILLYIFIMCSYYNGIHYKTTYMYEYMYDTTSFISILKRKNLSRDYFDWFDIFGLNIFWHRWIKFKLFLFDFFLKWCILCITFNRSSVKLSLCCLETFTFSASYRVE